MSDSEKLKKILTALINSRKIRNDSEFCDITGYSSGNLSIIKSGKRKIPANLKIELVKKFSVNPEFLSNESDEIFSKSEPDTIRHEPSAAVYDKLIKILEDRIDDLRKEAEVLTADLDVFRTVVKKGVEEGAIRFVKPNVK